MKNVPKIQNTSVDTLSCQMSALLRARSKHSTYQEIHPSLQAALDLGESACGKSESARWLYMKVHLNWEGRKVIDIGANTGYFSIAATQAQASRVVAVEGNAEHAQFIRLASLMIGLDKRLVVEHRYFDFEQEGELFDVALCLNVLHHLGDDFGDQHLSIEQARQAIAEKLKQLSHCARHCWFQLGFNWKGNRHTPLFQTGLKSELVEFVRQACGTTWTIENIAAFNPYSGAYETINDALLKRFDEIGEFLNRPIFLLESRSVLKTQYSSIL